jgi:hypothetical protein
VYKLTYKDAKALVQSGAVINRRFFVNQLGDKASRYEINGIWLENKHAYKLLQMFAIDAVVITEWSN